MNVRTIVLGGVVVIIAFIGVTLLVKRIAAAVAQFSSQGKGVSANVAINDLRLTGIACDDKTLRIIADAKGTVNVAVSSLAWQ